LFDVEGVELFPGILKEQVCVFAGPDYLGVVEGDHGCCFGAEELDGAGLEH
jgi:hypothetical protein